VVVVLFDRRDEEPDAGAKLGRGALERGQRFLHLD
jgi:hypothetical protein